MRDLFFVAFTLFSLWVCACFVLCCVVVLILMAYGLGEADAATLEFEACNTGPGVVGPCPAFLFLG